MTPSLLALALSQCMLIAKSERSCRQTTQVLEGGPHACEAGEDELTVRTLAAESSDIPSLEDVPDDGSDDSLELLQLGAAVRTEDSSLPAHMSQVRHVYESLHKWESAAVTESPDTVASIRNLDTNFAAVFGVFCMAADVTVRSIIRDTWMRNSQVCTILSPPKPECLVHAGFILGKGKGEPSDDVHDDIIVLHTQENMDEGKSYQYFYEVSRRFGWATHIVKLDTDTYPFLHVLLPRIVNVSAVAQQKGCDVYLGMFVPGWFPDCQPSEEGCIKKPPCALDCDYPLHGNLENYEHSGDDIDGAPDDEKPDKTKDDQCWGYMAGGLYVVSRRIALEATAEGLEWSQDKEGQEDAVTGHHLVEYSRGRDICLSGWDPPNRHDSIKAANLRGGKERGWMHLADDSRWRLVELELGSGV
eukprot:TRINITY_DN122810_c0_g1_i1.p1 TRINITY_DN122810_c0_g1~~TRINITY_DN122810_c0_g1_i1.p1  ORF type:complete len:416 (-),score=48.56 TRINITY_DN122810_c0_g1_i1:163-1410(-)